MAEGVENRVVDERFGWTKASGILFDGGERRGIKVNEKRSMPLIQSE
jgi:hypothetical protein